MRVCYTVWMRPGRLPVAILMLCCIGVAAAAPDVFVAYPDADAQVPFDHVILEGSVTPGASLTVDGKAVNTGPDGLFMEWWPLRPGTNDLRLLARQDGQTRATTVRVIRRLPRVMPATPTSIDRGSVAPREAREYWDAANDAPNERSVTVSFNGSPGGRANFRVGGGAVQSMQELPAGTYTATYVLPPSARAQNVAFTVSLTGRDGRTITAVAPGRLSATRSGPRTGTQKPGTVQGQGLNEATVVLTDLDGNPTVYPRPGMAFTVVGRVGLDLRVRLAPGVPALVSASQLAIGPGAAPAGSGGPITLSGAVPVTTATAPVPELSPALSAPEYASAPATPVSPANPSPAAAPVAPAGPDPYPELAPVPASAGAPALISPPPAPVTPAPQASAPGDLRVRVPLGGARLPFTIEQVSNQQLTLTLFGTVTAPIQAPTTRDPLLARVDIRPLGLKVTQVHLHLNAPQAWGFTANYDGPDLVVSVRRPPQLNASGPLAGRTITLDPGHGGSQRGGAGSLRVPEKDLVLPIALRAAEVLRGLGATVTMTRTTDQTVDLYDRGLTAENTRADLLVSIHANALPDGRDPRGIRGPEVYFTHPQAAGVAGAILAQLRARLPEHGAGRGLMPGANLALTRPSTQLSLLVETAYLTDPGNLRALNSPGGRERFAQAIAGGIAAFYATQVP